MRRCLFALLLIGCERAQPPPAPAKPGLGPLYGRDAESAPLLETRARERFERGDVDGGLADFLLLARAGIDEMSAPSIESWMRGHAILLDADRLFRGHIASLRPDAKHLPWMLEHLDSLTVPSIEPAMERERDRCLASVDDWTRKGFVAWPAHLRSDVPDLADPAIAEMDRALRQRPDETARWLREGIERLWKGETPAESTGRKRIIDSFADLLVKAWVPYPEKVRRCGTLSQVLLHRWILWCEAHAFRLAEGRFPASLHELGREPSDPFGGSYLYFSEAGRFIVASRGPNDVAKDALRIVRARWDRLPDLSDRPAFFAECVIWGRR